MKIILSLFILLQSFFFFRVRVQNEKVTIIHEQGQFDCHTFRIPAMVATNKGTLLAVYDMRYNSRRDLQGHMDIGLSRSTDGGETRARPVPIMDMKKFGGLPEDHNGCSDPNILVDRKTGEILVSAVWTHGKAGDSSVGRERIELCAFNPQIFPVHYGTVEGRWADLSEPENWTKRLKDPKWCLFAPAPGMESI